MTYQELLKSHPMRYWSLPSTSSDNQKKKLQKALSGSDYFLTKKRDGAMYRFGFDGKDVIFQSRTVSKKTGEFVEKQDNVPALMKHLSDIVPPNTILIGEICFKDLSKTSKDVVSIMGCLPKKSIERQQANPVDYYIFDILMWDGVDYSAKPAEERVKFLQEISPLFDSNLVSFVQPVFENIVETISEWLERGEEGGVLMHKKSAYDARLDKEGKPSWVTIKVKQSLKETLDLVIMEILPATQEYKGKYLTTHRYWENIVTNEKLEGNYHGRGGQYRAISEDYFRGLPSSIKLGAWYNGKLIEVCRVSGITDEFKWSLKNNPEEHIGKTVIEVSAMSIDEIEKTLRHPKIVRIRDDKPSESCLYKDIF
jgi:ATP-dependent DNA ligase